MVALLSIGEFSRLTHVSVKALRHYHDLDLLCPARIDPGSGYRFYAIAQAPTAQLIRRFRDLGMPLDQVKVVLTATDPTVRDGAIANHLRSMEQQLEQTKTAVASLRRLLEGVGSPSSDVAFRTLTSASALFVSARVAWDEAFVWLRDTLSGLRREMGHPDLITADVEAEVARLVGLGATWKADLKLGSMRWTTPLDPEGYEFDVVAEAA